MEEERSYESGHTTPTVASPAYAALAEMYLFCLTSKVPFDPIGMLRLVHGCGAGGSLPWYFADLQVQANSSILKAAVPCIIIRMFTTNKRY